MAKDCPLRVQDAAQAAPPLSPSGTLSEAQNSLVKSESRLVVHHVQSSPVLFHQSRHSSALLHSTPSPLVLPKQPHSVQPQLQIIRPSQELVDGVSQTQSAAVHQFQSPPSNAQAPPGQNLFFDEIHAATSTKKGIHRKMTIEVFLFCNYGINLISAFPESFKCMQLHQQF